MPRIDQTPSVRRLRRALVDARAQKPEGIHQVRVESRRLRAWLSLGRMKAPRTQLREMCVALGPARDLDVLIAHLPNNPSLQRARLALQPEVATALRPVALRDLFVTLETLRGPRSKTAHKRLKRFRKRVRHALERHASRTGPARLDALHTLRREVRTWRYAREWLGLSVGLQARAQKALGAVCDLLVLRDLLRALPATSDTQRALQRLDRALNRFE